MIVRGSADIATDAIINQFVNGHPLHKLLLTTLNQPSLTMSCISSTTSLSKATLGRGVVLLQTAQTIAIGELNKCQIEYSATVVVSGRMSPNLCKNVLVKANSKIEIMYKYLW